MGREANISGLNDVCFHILHDHLDVGIYVTDIDTYEILYLNHRLCKFFNFSDPAQALGRRCYEVAMPALGGVCPFCSCEKLLKHPDQPASVEVYNDIAGVYFRTQDVLIDWTDGKKAILHSVFDITETRKNEARIRENSERQKVIAEISQLFASVMNAEDMFDRSLVKLVEILKLNASYMMRTNREEKIFYLSNHATKPGYQSVVKATDRLPLDEDEPIYRGLKEGKPWIVLDFGTVGAREAKVFERSKSVKFIGIPILLSGEIWALLCCTSQNGGGEWTEEDISFLQVIGNIFSTGLERKYIEQEILERDRQLQESIVAAENANAAKSAFLSRMSHEMRTPMTAIIGMADIAQKSDEMARMKECIRKIQTSSGYLLSIINDILDMSKIESGKLEIAEEAFELEDLLKNVYDVVSIRAGEKRQVLDWRVADQAVGRYVGDPLRITQAITNLVYNAIKFSPDGAEVVLDVSLKESVGDEAVLEFAVKDHGIGMDKAQVGRLFAVFEQGDGGTARKYGGSGLGLAITKNIIELMGGEIRVWSELGVGSTFAFTVKVKRCTVAAGCEMIEKEEGVPDFRGKRVLLAEDVEINREIVKALLEDTGVEIDCAENGKIASEMVAGNPEAYDLVLMDIQMPIMDGYEATKAIRERAKGIPIVAMTANAFQEDVDRCIACGMNAHVRKPIDEDMLFATMKSYLS